MRKVHNYIYYICLSKICGYSRSITSLIPQNFTYLCSLSSSIFIYIFVTSLSLVEFYKNCIFFRCELISLFRIPQKISREKKWNFLRRHNVVLKPFDLTSIFLRPTIIHLCSSTPPPLLHLSSTVST